MKTSGKSMHKSAPYDLKGKLFKQMKCGCCAMQNFKDKFLERIAKKEMKDNT